VGVQTTADMLAALESALPSADVLLMAAAPADYRPEDTAPTKRPRAKGGLSLDLVPTPDLLESTRGKRKAGAIIVGFALETGDAERKGREKLERKGLDLIVVNDALEPGAGFEVETNRVVILDRDGGRSPVPLSNKRDVAGAILDQVEARLGR
jgi:phosphopantothenoylcysteine decarboxylase/phosphopantothenate--cysteine ligase